MLISMIKFQGNFNNNQFFLGNTVSEVSGGRRNIQSTSTVNVRNIQTPNCIALKKFVLLYFFNKVDQSFKTSAFAFYFYIIFSFI